MTAKKSMLRRIGAGVGALALATTGVLAVGPAAFAAPNDPAITVGPDQPEAEGAQGRLTINKLVGNEGSTRDDGLPNTDVTGDPLEGAEFTIWRLGTDTGGTCEPLDLRDTDDWDSLPSGETAPATLAEVEAAGYCAVEFDVVETLADGTASVDFDNTELGLYYVQETDAPANIVSTTAPFYVSVPLPNGAAHDHTWNYDVHVYPKNQELDAPEKTISDSPSALIVGSTVEWTIQQTVPALNAGETYESASFWDELSEGLAYADTTSVTVDGVDLPYTVDATGNPVEWTITEPSVLTAGQEIQVVFTTTVEAVTATGEIINAGTQYGSEFNGGTTPGEPDPRTFWGELVVNKVDEAGQPLAGAQFQVFPANADNTCATELPTTQPVSTGTSDAAGLVQWTPNTPDNSSRLGLWIANSNGPLDPAPTKVYCLYETVVPAGYVSQTPVQDVEVTPGQLAEAGFTTVTNVQKDGPDLPLTGAQGTLLMTAGGLLIIAIGMAAILIARRRNNQAA